MWYILKLPIKEEVSNLVSSKPKKKNLEMSLKNFFKESLKSLNYNHVEVELTNNFDTLILKIELDREDGVTEQILDDSLNLLEKYVEISIGYTLFKSPIIKEIIKSKPENSYEKSVEISSGAVAIREIDSYSLEPINMQMIMLSKDNKLREAIEILHQAKFQKSIVEKALKIKLFFDKHLLFDHEKERLIKLTKDDFEYIPPNVVIEIPISELANALRDLCAHTKYEKASKNDIVKFKKTKKPEIQNIPRNPLIKFISFLLFGEIRFPAFLSGSEDKEIAPKDAFKIDKILNKIINLLFDELSERLKKISKI